jgi:hypothetical protein
MEMNTEQLKLNINTDIYKELECVAQFKGLSVSRLATIAIFNGVFNNDIFHLSDSPPSEKIPVTPDQRLKVKGFVSDYPNGIGYDLLIMNCLSLDMTPDEIRTCVVSLISSNSFEFFYGQKTKFYEYPEDYISLRIKGKTPKQLRDEKKERNRVNKKKATNRMAFQKHRVLKKLEGE